MSWTRSFVIAVVALAIDLSGMAVPPSRAQQQAPADWLGQWRSAQPVPGKSQCSFAPGVGGGGGTKDVQAQLAIEILDVSPSGQVRATVSLDKMLEQLKATNWTGELTPAGMSLSWPSAKIMIQGYPWTSEGRLIITREGEERRAEMSLVVSVTSPAATCRYTYRGLVPIRRTP